MTDLDQLVKRAFDDVTVPDEAKRAALERIEALRASADCSVCAQQPAQTQDSRDEGGPATSRRQRSRRTVVRWVGAAAACFILVIMGFGAVNLYREPIAYVGIDVNPSIELGLNRLGIVVESSALNDDGLALLEGVSLEGRAYEDALEALTASEVFAPYAQQDAFVEISVSSDDPHLTERLRSQSDACLSVLPCHGSCHEVDAATREAAAAAGMGVGRYRAALELMELDPDMTLEECASLSMRQLRELIAERSQGEEDELQQGGEGYGSSSQGGKSAHRHGGSGAHRHGRESADG